MQTELQSKSHMLELSNCKLLKLNGVDEVVSFDDTLVVLLTPFGTLHIEGEGLHVTQLDLEKGIVILDGTITGIFYTKAKEKSGKGFARR